MKTQMIVNRINDWFSIEDLELDTYMLSMNILLKLSRFRDEKTTFENEVAFPVIS